MNENEEDRYCNECKHLLGRRSNEELADTWKCLSSQNVVAIGRDLVTGRQTYNLRFETCYDARSDDAGCGSSGQWFERYAPYTEPRPTTPFRPKVAGGISMTAEALLAELEGTTEGEKK